MRVVNAPHRTAHRRHHAVARRASGNTHDSRARGSLRLRCTVHDTLQMSTIGTSVLATPRTDRRPIGGRCELPARYIAPRQMDLPFGSFPRSVSTTPPFRTSDCARRDESRPRRRRPVAALLSRHCVLSRDCRCGARPVLSQARGSGCMGMSALRQGAVLASFCSMNSVEIAISELDRRDRYLSEPLT